MIQLLGQCWLLAVGSRFSLKSWINFLFIVATNRPKTKPKKNPNDVQQLS